MRFWIWVPYILLAFCLGAGLGYLQHHHMVQQLKKQIDQLLSERYFTRGEVDTLSTNLMEFTKSVSVSKLSSCPKSNLKIAYFSKEIPAFTPEPSVNFALLQYADGTVYQAATSSEDPCFSLPASNFITFTYAHISKFHRGVKDKFSPIRISVDSLLAADGRLDTTVYWAVPDQAFSVVPQLGKIGSWEYWLVVVYHIRPRTNPGMGMGTEHFFVPIVFRFSEPKERVHLMNWTGEFRDAVVLFETMDFSPHNFSFHPNFTLYTNGYSGSQLIPALPD